MLLNKIYTFCFVLIEALAFFIFGWICATLNFWTSPSENKNPLISIMNAILEFPHKSINLKSMDSDFKIKYVKNAHSTSPSPYFPAINANLVDGDAPDAWIQIICRQKGCETEKKFVYGHKDFPFYSMEAEFIDSPIYTYELFSPNMRWISNTYAVKLVSTENGRSMQIVGGFSWGFCRSKFEFRPRMIEPQPLGEKDWSNDYPLFKEEFGQSKTQIQTQKDSLEKKEKMLLETIV